MVFFMNYKLGTSKIEGGVDMRANVRGREKEFPSKCQEELRSMRARYIYINTYIFHVQRVKKKKKKKLGWLPFIL